MNRALVALVAVIVLALAGPAAASAAVFPTVADAVKIADQAWPASPCAGRLTVSENPALIAEGFDGWTENDGSCRIEIASDLASDPRHRCDIIAHEAGHRAGLAHTETGIMRATPEPYGPCHSATPAIIAKIRRALAGPWKVTCGADATLMSCRAKRHGSVARRYRVEVYDEDNFRIDRIGLRLARPPGSCRCRA